MGGGELGPERGTGRLRVYNGPIEGREGDGRDAVKGVSEAT